MKQSVQNALGRVAVPLLVAALFLCISALYYYLHVTSSRDYLQQRNFRQLNVMAGNIQQRISNFRTVMKNAPAREGQPNNTLQKRGPYEYSYQQYLQRAGLTDCAATDDIGSSSAGKDVHVDLLSSPDSIWIRFTDRLRHCAAKITLQSLLDPVVNRNVFEELFVTTERGEVLYQTGDMDLQLQFLRGINDRSRRDSVQRRGDIGMEIGKDTLAGTEYDLFMAPLELGMVQMASGESTQNPASSPHFHGVLCGTVKTSDFSKQTMSLSYNVIAIFIFVLAMLGLSSRLLKLRMLAPHEEFRRFDVYITVFAGLLGIALCVLAALSTFTYLSILRNQVDTQLMNLAEDLDSSFRNDLRRGMMALEEFDALKGESTRDSVYCKSKYLPYVYAFWIDSTGMQETKWGPQDSLTPKINVSSAAYYTHVRDGRMWELDGKRYFCDPHVSWTDGKFLVALSMPKRRGRIPVIDYRPASLVDPVILGGPGFCIIDDAGEVVFHSQNERNARENFFEECGNDLHLRSAVVGHYTDHVDVSYWGEDHRIFVRPMAGLPWSIVTFQEKTSLRSLNLEAITISITLYLALLVGLVVMFLGLHGPWKFRAKWLWPSDQHKETYERLTIILTGLAAILFLSAKWAWSPDSILLATFLSPAIGFGVCYVLVQRPEGANRWYVLAFILLGVFLVSFFTWYLFLPWLLIAIPLLIKCWPAVTVFFRKQASASPVQRVQYTLRDPGTKRAYLSAAMALVLLAAIVPISNFYTVAFSQQFNLFIRFHQMNFVNQMEAAHRQSPKVYAAHFFRTDASPLDGAQAREVMNHLDPNRSLALSLLDTLQRIAAPNYNTTCLAMESYIAKQASDTLWRFANDEQGKRKLVKLQDEGGGQVITTVSQPDLLTTWQQASLLLLLAGLAVFPVRYTLRKSYFLSVHHLLDDAESNPVHELSYRHLFILDAGTPDFTYGLSPCADGMGEMVLIDLAEPKGQGSCNWRGQLAGAHKTVLIRHFERDAGEPYATEKKLELLEAILETSKRACVISAIDPSLFAAPKGNGKTEDLALRWRTVQQRFLRLDYRNHHSKRPRPDPQRMPGFKNYAAITGEKTHLQYGECGLVCTECEGEMKLAAMIPGMVEYCRTLEPFDPESIIREILHRADVYYTRLWDTCTPAERRTLVDLARDGFPNPANDGIVQDLLRRGLIQRKPNLEVMNKSFNRFILSKSREVSFSPPTEDQQVSGWRAYRGIFLVIFMLLVLFLLTTQQQVLNNTITYLTTLGTLIPLVLKIIGSFKGGALTPVQHRHEPKTLDCRKWLSNSRGAGLGD